MRVADSWRSSVCLLVVGCAVAASTTQAAVIALKRDAGLNTGGAIDARFTSATVALTTVSDAPLWSPGESRWANGGRIALPNANFFLYKFDLTSVPDLANTTINLAELRLYHTAGNGGQGLGGVAPVVTHDWIEGLGEVEWTYYPGAAGGVSYAHPIGYNTGPYQNASGGTEAPTQSWGSASDSFFDIAVDAGTAQDPHDGQWSPTDFHVFDVTSHVQAWVSGTSPNYGWAQAPGYWNFHHSEIGWEFQPVLFVDYTPDMPTVAFDVTSSSGGESVTPVYLSVSLSESSAQTVTVDFAVTGGSAVNPNDYTIAASPLTFNPGVTQQDVVITVVDDGLVESDETIEVTLSNPNNATLGANTVHTYTINDDDVYPTVAFDLTASSGDEPVTPASLAVSLSAVYPATVTVDYAVTGGDATGGGVDYTLAAGTLTFDPNDVSKTIDITIVDDGLVESDETIEVTLSNPTNATLGTNTVHTYTILDNDEPSDTTPPDDVTDLSVSNVASTTVWLTWTASGDDGSTGTATSYDVRYSTSPIDAGNWASASQATGEPAPQVAGSTETFVLSGLSETTTYYFAVKTSDEVPNESGLS
ncbi:MAG TPA: Calx-beta domain-containing protein, partial [Phycisphaerae bacterium]|nr:Calx-beta domain-containing protein [Phycisphaerae bacterium]